jgi:hypothetical protein
VGHGRAHFASLTFILCLTLLIGSCVLTSKPARAACAGPSNYEVYIRDSADLIVSGTAGEVEVSMTTTRAELRVDRVFKGTSGETLFVTTLGSQARNYAVPFTTGDRYLLYLMREGNSYTTSICSGSQPVGDSLPPELAETLGEEETAPGIPQVMPLDGWARHTAVRALAGLMAFGIGVVWRWAR